MDSIAPIAIVVGILFVICVVAKAVVGEGKSKPEKPKYFYSAKKHLMTTSEEEFFRTLCKLFVNRCYVFPQVHLSAVLNHKTRGQDWRAAFFHINGKSVDFLLCDKKTLQPICAIELDDHTHEQGSRVDRDIEVERIFTHAKLPLVRFRDYRSLSDKSIVDKIAGAINTH